MNDKERIKYYLELLEKWQECLSAFFEHECLTAPPGGVRVLLDGHRDIVSELKCRVTELPNK